MEEAELRCGAEPPIHRPSAEALVAAGQPALPIHNDCSGKHSFMLAASHANGWPLDYRPADHPLQRRVVALARAWTGEAPALATDGCGVPTLYVSVTGMARAWAYLAAAMADRSDPWDTPDAPTATDPIGRAARVGWAMARHPWLTSGDGRLDLSIAAGSQEPMVGKIGAQGIFCMAWPARRLGIAVKVLSGDEDALAVAVEAALATLCPDGWRRSDTTPWPWATVRNVVGDVVGSRVAAGHRGAYPSDD